MHSTSDYSTKQIRTPLDYAESNAGLLKSLTSAAKTLFESSEHAAKVAVVVLVVSLVVFSFNRVVDCGTRTAQYCDAITKMSYIP